MLLVEPANRRAKRKSGHQKIVTMATCWSKISLNLEKGHYSTYAIKKIADREKNEHQYNSKTDEADDELATFRIVVFLTLTRCRRSRLTFVSWVRVLIKVGEWTFSCGPPDNLRQLTDEIGDRPSHWREIGAVAGSGSDVTNVFFKKFTDWWNFKPTALRRDCRTDCVRNLENQFLESLSV